MSRVPLYLQPSLVESDENEFSVLSEEWSDDWRAPQSNLGTLIYEPTSKTCTFLPEPLWVAEGLFPKAKWSCTKESLAQVLANPESYSPKSIYSVRLLKAVEQIFVLRGAPSSQSPGSQNAG